MEQGDQSWLYLLRIGGPALAASTLERFRELARAEGYRAGQESMRERAARVALDGANWHLNEPLRSDIRADECRALSAAIRSLPIGEE